MQTRNPARHRNRGALFAASLPLFFTWASGATASPPPRYSVQTTTLTENIPLIILRDETSRIEAAVAPSQGGELASLRVEYRGRWNELLYRGRNYEPAPGFRGKASILWPTVGSTFPAGNQATKGREENLYEHLGLTYPMPQHGFARSQSWQLVRTWANETEAAVEIVLKDNADSRTKYPFGFELRVIYRVCAGRVELDHRVMAAATNATPMFFSIGNHIAFRVPLLADSTVDAITVESPACSEYLRGADGTPNGITRPLSFQPAVLLKDLKTVPAMSVGDYMGEPWLRLADAGGLAIKVSHLTPSNPTRPFVQFNLWGGTREGYFCPEPFLGLHNSFNKKIGLINLAPGDSWTWLIRVEPERASNKKP